MYKGNVDRKEIKKEQIAWNNRTERKYCERTIGET